MRKHLLQLQTKSWFFPETLDIHGNIITHLLKYPGIFFADYLQTLGYVLSASQKDFQHVKDTSLKALRQMGKAY